jgi:hypothetical protein
MAAPRHRWLQFSLRAFLVALTICCVWLGWQAERANRQKKLVDAIERRGGQAIYDCDSSANITSPPSSRTSGIFEQILGRDFLHTVVEVNFAFSLRPHEGQIFNYAHMSDDVVPLLIGLPGIQKVVLHYKQATDDSLRMIGTLTSLEELNVISASTLTDRGIDHIKALPKLKSLILYNAALTDESLAAVSQLASLERLEMWNSAAEGGTTRFTDQGLMNLGRCQRLRKLNVRNTGVSDAGAAMLQEHLPGCSIDARWDGPRTRRDGKWVPDVGRKLVITCSSSPSLIVSPRNKGVRRLSWSVVGERDE